MCMSGLFVAIELKTDEGKLSALQEYNLSVIADSGGHSIVMNPSNFVEVIEKLRTISKNHSIHLNKMEIWR